MTAKLGFQAALAVLLAALAAYALKTSYVAAMGIDPETEMLDDFADMMIEAQDLFGYNTEDFISLGEGVAPGLTLIAGGNGLPYFESAGGPEVFDPLAYGMDTGQAEFLYTLFSGVEIETSETESTTGDGGETVETPVTVTVTVRLIVSDENYIKMYTHFDGRGYVGIFYDRGGDNPQKIDSIELFENWSVFNIME